MEIKKPQHHPDVYRPQIKKKLSPEFLSKYAEIAKRISNSPTSRGPSPDDVESFDESYRKLGLHRRWGA